MKQWGVLKIKKKTMNKLITAEIDEELREDFDIHGYDDVIPYKELTPAFVGISIHDGRLCYDENKIPSTINETIPLDEYHIVTVSAELDDDSVVFSEEFYSPSIIGVTTANRVVYDYDKMISILAEEYAKGDGKVFDDLEDDEQYEYITSAQEWIDFNTIRSLPYDIMNGKPMPIVIQDIRDKSE